MSLRPYQIDALKRAREAIDGGAQSALIQLPTGCGKTRTAVEACIGHVRLGGVPMFVAPRRELIQQASAALTAQGLEPGHDVFVRTIQELSITGATIPRATMVVLDEARHYVADAWARLRKSLPDAIYLGLDATPERGDGRGLGGMFDVLIEGITVRSAIDAGYLVPCDVLRPDRALGSRELAQDPCDAYIQHARDRSAVLFAPTVELAREYATRLTAEGVSAAAVWGDMPIKDRDSVLAEYGRRNVHVLTNVMVLTEGWDVPHTEVVILARGAGTAGSYLQMVGRGMRPSPGKARMMLIDLAGISHIHGEPDEPRTWHLDGRAARRTAEIDIRFCPVCGSPTTTSECEVCGHTGEMRDRRPRVLGLPVDRFSRQRQQGDDEQARALARYIADARRRGYKPGWAYAKFRSVYGRNASPDVAKAATAMATQTGVPRVD